MSPTPAPGDKKPVMMSGFPMLVLLCAGVAGNFLRYDIFFNIQFVFGSIFAMLVLQLFGLRWGVFSGLVISTVTWHIWNHPYAIIVMTAEVLVVGLIVRSRKAGLVLADALYWLVLGMPLVFLFYFGVMHLPLYTAVATMLKQATNGIANALIARLLFVAVSRKWSRETLSMREVLFDLMVLFCLLPALLLIARESRDELVEIDGTVRTALALSSKRVEREINGWLEHHILRVEQVAWMAARMPVSDIQKSIEQTLAGEKDFLRMGLLDRSATIVAYWPLLDEMGQRNIGRNFKDRPFIPALEKTLKPMLSEVVMGRMGASKPMVTALAPVVVHGRYSGYVTGILDTDRLNAMIAFATEDAALLGREYILHDRNKNVIVSSRKSVKAMEPYTPGPGQVITLDKALFQWVPASERNISLSDRWKKAVYFTEGAIGGLSGWSLILEQPLAPYQKLLSERYSVQLAWIFAVLLAAVLTAEVISRKITITLEMLGSHSAGLPEKLVRGERLTLPASGIRETQQLIGNIGEMSEELSHKFHEVNALNATLEDRIKERTRELRVSEERFRSLIESSSDWIWEVDENGRYTYSSPQVRNVLGYESHEVVGKTPFDFMPPEEARRASVEFGALIKARRPITGMENINIHKQGHLVVLETSGVPVFDAEGRLTGYRGMDRDITQRRMAEEEVRRLANEQKIILDTVSVGVAFLRDRRVVWANPGYERLFGLDPGAARGMDARLVYVHSGDYERVGREGYELLNSGGIYSTEVESARRDGSAFWLSLSGRAVNVGKPDAGSIWILQDITERKRAEEALRRSEERFRKLANEQRVILETIAVGIAFAKNRKIIWANPAFEKIYGFDHNEFLGRDSRHLYAEEADYLKVGREGYPVIATGATYSLEVTAKRKDGGSIWISLIGRAVNPDSPDEGSIWMFQDISRRKAIEEALRENERLFREAIEFMPVPIGIANPEGTIRAYNKSFVETYGYTVKEIPTIEAWIQTVYPDAAYREQMRQVWNTDVEKAGREGGSTPIREYEVTCKNGGVKSVEITMRPIGPLFIATFYDVTVRKHVEKDLIEKTLQLQDLTRNLEKRVEEEIALRSRNEQMLVQQSKLAAMGEMLGAIAHQWRQPLNALGLIIQNVAETHRFGELDDGYIEMTVRKSMAHVQHMSETIDDFRNFFQPDKERTRFDSMQAVSEVLDLFSAQLESNNITCRLACHTHGTRFDMHTPIISCSEKMVEGYRNEFEHVILNLMNNSRDAILARRTSGIAVQGVISFDFENRNGKVIIAVSDNGGGMDPSIIERIFEPYFTTKLPAGGTGLGLYMAKVIIEKHFQGTLLAENRGDGAVFTIELQQAPQFEPGDGRA